MKLTASILKSIYRYAPFARLQEYAPILNDYMSKFGITTAERMRAFLAQVGHESGQLCFTVEIASGAAYEGRKDLGNTQKGDGVRFKGRGLIQITGRKNYELVANALGIDCVNRPELLEKPLYAVQSACWWWQNAGLNVIADIETEENFKKITKKINGGYNGLADRIELWNRAKKEIQ